MSFADPEARQLTTERFEYIIYMLFFEVLLLMEECYINYERKQKVKEWEEKFILKFSVTKVTLGETENHWVALRQLMPTPGFLAANLFNF
jgi:hypothetical protein